MKNRPDLVYMAYFLGLGKRFQFSLSSQKAQTSKKKQYKKYSKITMKLFKLAVYFCWIKTATISGMINRVAVSGDSTNLAEVKDSGEISIVNFSTLNIGVGGGGVRFLQFF